MEISKPHSVLDDLHGLREEAEQAHNRYHDWKKVPYWDCPLSPCSWFNNDLPLIETQIKSLFEQLEAAQDTLRRLRQWDMMVGGIGSDGEHHEATADAPYWRDQIDRALSNPAYRPEDDPLSPRGQFDGVILADSNQDTRP